ALGCELSPGERGIADALIEERPLDEVIRETATPGLHIAPASELLAAVDLHLSSVMGRERALLRILDAPGVRSHDLVIIDTAPYLGLLTTNALCASQKVLVPVCCEYLPMLGMKLFSETVEKIRMRLGTQVEVLGYLLTLYDKRQRITLEV